ncbi:MAG TPA: hypothetical protein VNG29_01580 [Candidatus Paceibacterota bacterium]|nr:hypothetical protein [Candidatus Paceibacterota bacterium]
MHSSENYINQSDKFFLQFKGDAERLCASGSGMEKAHGTTVVAFLTADKKNGIVASDGRISAGPRIMVEDFKKVFGVRTGFIGCAGALGMIQLVMSAFRVDLDNICNSRNVSMTASGSAKRLFRYYLEANRAGGNDGGVEFIPLFWDKESGKCHLYSLVGMSRISGIFSASAGSGSGSIAERMRNFKPQEYHSAESLLAYAKDALRAAAAMDSATNRKFFYGLIRNGVFNEGEEVL